MVGVASLLENSGRPLGDVSVYQDGISSVSRSLRFCSVDVSLFRLPVTTQAVLSPQNHLLGHLLGPETLPRSQ